MTMKKFATMLLALVLVLAMAVPAYAAAGQFTISVKAGDTHTYEVYQIFTGVLSENSNTLSDLKWGENGKGIKGEAVEDTDLADLLDASSDAAVVAAIKDLVDLDSDFDTVTVSQPLTVPAGYYLIKDVDTLTDGRDTYTTYIIRIAKDVEITRKASIPEVEKKVYDVCDSETNGKEEKGDTADHDIGDTVKFELTGTMNSNFADYTKYYYSFNDTMSDGLTFNEKSLKVYVKNGDIETEIITGFTLDTDVDDYTFQVIFADLKQVEGVDANSKIVVKYTAELNKDAVIGGSGNPNTVTLTYSRKPGTDEKGTTPEDTVIVFTFKGTINKVTYNEENEQVALEGAAFALYKYDGQDWKPVDQDAYIGGPGTQTTFTFTGLDAGLYMIEETTTPDGYNSIDPFYFMITAVHSELNGKGSVELSAVLCDAEGKTIKGDGNFTFTILDNNANASVDILNQSGAQLPETGGIGTTIFYAVGGLLVLAAVLLLVTKRRMGSNN